MILSGPILNQVYLCGYLIKNLVINRAALWILQW
jgi:hypothetical protein